MKWLSDLWARVRGRQQLEPPEPPQRTPEDELRWEALQDKERKLREDEPDKDRYQDV